MSYDCKLDLVQFSQPVTLPNRTSGQTIVANENVSLEKVGDVIIVVAHMPENETRGFPVDVVELFNWSMVIRAVPSIPAVKKAK